MTSYTSLPHPFKHFLPRKKMEVSFSPFLIPLLKTTLIITSFFRCAQPLCHSHESSALLQFKNSFVIDKSTSADPLAYPKVESWSHDDCCFWDGIQCDKQTGYVTEVDLSSSCLFGSINSTSRLFHLTHLHSLNLAYNHFNYSQIPSAIGNLTRLKYLDLSYSYFYGQVPLEISKLSKLSSLNLALNVDVFNSSSNVIRLLELRSPGFGFLLQNLTKLTQLTLNYVDTSSTVPYFLSNFSSLTSIYLTDCGLYGDFPESIFQLPNLQFLSLAGNKELTGSFPEFQSGSPLKELKLWGTNFSGDLSSIGELDSLDWMDLEGCKFSGLIPSSIGKLISLTNLNIPANNFNGQIPFFLQNLTQLTRLGLGRNQLTGQIPPWLANLTQLTYLSLEQNKLHGMVPRSFSGLKNLETLNLHSNELSGTVDFDLFLDMKSLTRLQLSDNKLSLLTTDDTTNINATTPQFRILGLGSCNLRNFPSFLRYQDNLMSLELGANEIYGQIPKWVWNISLETMVFFSLSHNFLTGFDQPPTVLPWVRLNIFFLNDNMLNGSLPIPPLSIVNYDVSYNKLSGEISPLFCNLSSLQYLNLAGNNLSGVLPQCLNNLSGSLLVLSLLKNHFHGIISDQICTDGSQLRVIDLSYNQFQGRLPTSLPNCMMLQVLNLGNNQLVDKFPSWLGTLPDLRLLVLRSNRFHGIIGKPLSDSAFPSLRVIDLSYNNFTGMLPSEYFQKWNSMKHVDASSSTYMKANSSFDVPTQSWTTKFPESFTWTNEFPYSITITIKGIDRVYGRIQDVLAVIDLSSNNFNGGIPESIGSLQGLHVLNLSNNILSGSIPSALGNISQLESLDLSQNRIHGEIPNQLMQLTFLSVFNVSHNHLTGPIPQGNQFATFDNSSYDGNLGLCGYPLPNKCGNSESPTVEEEEEEEEEEKDSGSLIEFDWRTILPGYGGGLIVGIVVGNIVFQKKEYWLEVVSKLGYKFADWLPLRV